jgi:pyruvate dehydrogenase complex dehydrogenase (E1) component
LALNNPAPQEFVAVNDSFGESGTPAQLMEKYKLNNQAIVAAVERVIKENNLLICTDSNNKTHLVLRWVFI